MDETPNPITIDWPKVLALALTAFTPGWHPLSSEKLEVSPMAVIKAIRNIYKFGLKECKEIYDAAIKERILIKQDWHLVGEAQQSSYGNVILGPNAGVLPIVNPISTVNVIEINGEVSVASLASYPDNPGGVKMAEERYIALITENLTPDEHKEFDGVERDGALDAGFYEIGDWKILLVHSTLGSKQ